METDTVKAILKVIGWLCFVPSGYFFGKAHGYREARKTYIPMVMQAERDRAIAVDVLAMVTGEEPVACERFNDFAKNVGSNVKAEVPELIIEELQEGL